MRNTRKLRVLVAEDNSINVAVLRVQLERMGCQATIVGDGLSALNAYAAGKFDLVLMDIQLPVLDGLSTIQTMRKMTEGGKPSAIIVLSACTMESDQDEALKAGADFYLSKPIRSKELLDALKTWGPSWYRKVCDQLDAA